MTRLTRAARRKLAEQSRIDKFPSDVWAELVSYLEAQWVYNLFLTGNGRIRKLFETQKVVLKTSIPAKLLPIFKRFQYLESCDIAYVNRSQVDMSSGPLRYELCR